MARQTRPQQVSDLKHGAHRNFAILDAAIMSAGAYGMSMSSNYNTRPRAAEVMVSGAEMHLIRARESVAQQFALERMLP